MRELLKFEYYRIWKSKVLWLMVAFAALAPILAAAALSFILHELEPDLLEEINFSSSNEKFFTWYVISYFYERLPLIMALFVPLFIGRDYKDGVIRNKLTAGHTRFEIFTSYVVTQVSVTVALSIVYILCGTVAMACTKFGVNLNHGEMLLRAGTLLLALIATTTLFAVISLLIKSRAGTTVICIAFIFSLGIFSLLSTNFSYSHKMIDQYQEIYEEKVGDFEVPDMYMSYYSPKEFDRDSYFNAGWYIGHPIFLLTDASLSDEFVPDFQSMLTFSDDELFGYPKKVSRTAFVDSLYAAFMGTGSGLITGDDLKKIDGAYVNFATAELQYNIKSIIWLGIYFGGGYALFRKKNIF